MTADHGATPVLLLEFNELSPSLMERFVREGLLPNFKILHDESEVYTTQAVEKYPYLEPWIQWITVHSGLNYDEHGVYRLGDGGDLKKPCVWDLLSEHHFRVWLCGSMNIRYDSPINGYVLPDPWTSTVRPFPDSLAAYYRFVQAHVLQEYTNDRVPLSVHGAARPFAVHGGGDSDAAPVRALWEVSMAARGYHGPTPVRSLPRGLSSEPA
jgi:hypothetical protein